MKKQQLHKFLAKTHKWIGLVLGLQVLAWTVGGVVMSWIPIDTVRGTHNVEEHAPVALPNVEGLLPLGSLASQEKGQIQQATYKTLLGRPVVRLVHMGGEVTLVDAGSGELLSPIDEQVARQIADADFKPDVPIASSTLLDAHTIDYRGPLPVWQVMFADEDTTSIYVSPAEGLVLARRSATWRLYDFFWMLHIMDYDERENFNNPLIMTFAFSASLFTLSGLGLVFFRFYRRDFNWLLGRRRRL
ncbi:MULTISPECIES: hypothetical protein [Kordiimonas]|uniref:hypothetical protein n=1 Tax=Kordiimonas TaxID=288021 RepID=UPI002579861F|nr:hypothetical protein [Kordiimonas sp. UBA4487]